MKLSLDMEQAVIIKFLTLEGSETLEICQRIKKIYKQYTLPKRKVLTIHKVFCKKEMCLDSIFETFEDNGTTSTIKSESDLMNPLDFDESCSVQCSQVGLSSKLDQMDDSLISAMDKKSSFLDCVKEKPQKRLNFWKNRSYSAPKNSSFTDWPEIIPAIKVKPAEDRGEPLKNFKRKVNNSHMTLRPIDINLRTLANKNFAAGSVQEIKEEPVDRYHNTSIRRETSGVKPLEEADMSSLASTSSNGREGTREFGLLENTTGTNEAEHIDVEDMIDVKEENIFDDISTCVDDASNQSLSIVEANVLPNQLICKRSGVLTCLLCPQLKFPYRSKAVKHVQCLHFKGMVSFGNYWSLRCKRYCYAVPPKAKKEKSHFHCPYCSWCTPDYRRLFKHALKKHARHRKKKIFTIKRTTEITTNEFPSVCVDPVIGIYMVPKMSTVSSEPIHVLKRVDECGNYEFQCSQELCCSSIRQAKRSGIRNLFCKHIKKVELDSSILAPSFQIEDEVFDALGLSEDLKWKCKKLSLMAKSSHISAVVEWSSHERFIYFSVISDDENNRPFKRVLVKCDPEREYYECFHLSSENSLCAHIIMVKLYLGLA